jgi:hypothetical protein
MERRMMEMSETQASYKVVNVRKVPLHLYRQAKALAKSRGQSLTWIVVRALEAYVREATAGPAEVVPGAPLRNAHNDFFDEIQHERSRAWSDTPKEVVLGMVKNLEAYLNAVK